MIKYKFILVNSKFEIINTLFSTTFQSAKNRFLKKHGKKIINTSCILIEDLNNQLYNFVMEQQNA